jgi:rhodanese-related sulfurtransferase
VTRPSWRRWLAGAAALAGALASLAGSPYRRADGERAARAIDATASPADADGAIGAINVAELARVVSDQDDHVSAIQLAAWIRARRPGLRIVDVRSAAEFAAFHIPGAEHVTLERLVATRFADDDTVVLYSETGVHGGQAWVFLRALGHRRAYFLRDGLHEWLDDVMSPTLAAGATPEARAAFAQLAELSRWFGGTPRELVGALERDAPASAPAGAPERDATASGSAAGAPERDATASGSAAGAPERDATASGSAAGAVERDATARAHAAVEHAAATIGRAATLTTRRRGC